jgi:AcrR family transcriptional regulator
MGMPRARTVLTRDDWIDAGLAAVREAGPDAVAVQPLAARLGATKGSFYWHFGTRAELLAAVLQRWRDQTEGIITATERYDAGPESGAGAARRRLRQLLALVTEASESAPGEQRIFAGVHEPAVAQAVADVTHRRMTYVAHLLEAAGVAPDEAPRRAWLGYTWYLGHAQLAATVPGAMPASRPERRRLLDEVVDFLVEPR